MIEARKKEGESTTNLLFRFTKKMKQSGVLTEARKRRFKNRSLNRRKRRLSAIYREARKADVAKKRKLGLL